MLPIKDVSLASTYNLNILSIIKLTTLLSKLLIKLLLIFFTNITYAPFFRYTTLGAI